MNGKIDTLKESFSVFTGEGKYKNKLDNNTAFMLPLPYSQIEHIWAFWKLK